MKRLALSLLAVLVAASLGRADTYVLVFSYYPRYKEPRQVIKTLSEFHPLVHVRSLIAKKATVANFTRAVQRMKGKLDTDDLAIIFIYSHGWTEKGEFYANVADGKLFGKQIRDAVEALPCPSLVLVDACGAGGLLREKWLKATVLCACMATEESSDGCTTKAFVEALEGRADANKDGKLQMIELVAYVVERSLATQHPVARMGPGTRRVIE